MLLKTNTAAENRPSQKETPSSNNPFSGATARPRYPGIQVGSILILGYSSGSHDEAWSCGNFGNFHELPIFKPLKKNSFTYFPFNSGCSIRILIMVYEIIHIIHK